MKKNIITKTLILLILVSFAFSPYVAAQASTALTFDEIGLSLTAPEGFYTVTENVEQHHPVFTELGYDYNETIDMFNSSDLYFWATTEDYSQSIYFAAIQDSSTEFILYDDQDFEEIFNDYKGRFSDDILIYNDYFIIEGEQHKFLAMLYEFTDGSEINGLDIVTITNGYSLSFELYSYTGEPIDNNTINALVSVVESIDFYSNVNHSFSDLDHQLDPEFEMSDESYYDFEPENLLSSIFDETFANDLSTVIIIVLSVIASFLLIYFIVLLIGAIISKNNQPPTLEKPIPAVLPEQIEDAMLSETTETTEDAMLSETTEITEGAMLSEITETTEDAMLSETTEITETVEPAEDDEDQQFLQTNKDITSPKA